MKILAKISNSQGRHQVILDTDGKSHALAIPPKPVGFGSSVNGGELLLLALATCYCNDLYREAARLEIKVSSVEVDVEGEFGAPGEPARSVRYRARVKAAESEERIRELMQVTDRLAEIQNTLRAGIPVTFDQLESVRE
jgi:organic hydroperoxide reductase OsmC/OhrA